MKVTIIKPDNMVGIDGMFYSVDCSSLPENLRVVQWDTSKGHIEWTDQASTEITDIGPYQPLIDAWVAIRAEFDARAADPYFGMTAEEILAAKDKAIRAKYAAMLLDIASPYGAEERETWKTQEEEALSWMADNTAACPMVTAMATARGITVESMAQKILENAALFRAASGQILGAQQAELDQLYA